MKRLVNKLKIWSGKALRLVLRRLFHFDQWHVFTLAERKYAQDIIRFCNNKHTRQSFVEIGCGLGDIIRNVRYQNKFGYDIDQQALKAASFLDKFSIKGRTAFSLFDFPSAFLPGKHDVIVMVNWIHHIPPMILKSKIREYISQSLIEKGIIIIDTVQDKGYKFNHDIKFLAGDDGLVTYMKLGDYERMRQIWILQKESR